MRENVIPLIVVKANTQRARGRLQKRKQTRDRDRLVQFWKCFS